jgi:putative membrane protein
MRPELLIGGGVLILVVAWLAPEPAPPVHGFTVHMARHLLVVAAAPPLLALGLRQAGWQTPPRCAWLLSPIPLTLLELLVVWGWHAPLLHAAARVSGLWFVLEQASFFAAGALLWLAVLTSGRERRALGILALLLTSMHMTLLGLLLALAPRALYAVDETTFCVTAASALADQQRGGILMLIVGGTVYLAGGLALLKGLLDRSSGQIAGRQKRLDVLDADPA